MPRSSSSVSFPLEEVSMVIELPAWLEHEKRALFYTRNELVLIQRDALLEEKAQRSNIARLKRKRSLPPPPPAFLKRPSTDDGEEQPSLPEHTETVNENHANNNNNKNNNNSYETDYGSSSSSSLGPTKRRRRQKSINTQVGTNEGRQGCHCEQANDSLV